MCYLTVINTLELHPDIDTEDIASEKLKDSQLQNFKQSKNTALKLPQFHVPHTNYNTSTKQPRPFLTEKLGKQIFDLFHNISHPGVKSSIKQLSEIYVWARMLI